MKISEHKQNHVKTGKIDKQTFYDTADGYVIDVLTHDGVYAFVLGEVVLFDGGADPDYPDDEIKFFWLTNDDDGDRSFSGPVADDVDVDVRLYKRI